MDRMLKRILMIFRSMFTTHLLPDGEDNGTEVQGVADTMVEVTGELEEGEMDSEADTVLGLS